MKIKLIIILTLVLASVDTLFASEAFQKANYTLTGVNSESLSTIKELSSQLTTNEKKWYLNINIQLMPLSHSF